MRFGYTRNPAWQLRREMDRLLSGFFNEFVDGGRFWFGGGQPAVNIWESPDALMVEAELPGITSDQVDMSVVGKELTLKVNRAEPQQEGVTYHRRERPTGEFTRVLRLPTEVDADHVQAELRNGVLTITLPKAEAARPRKIQIQSAK